MNKKRAVIFGAGEWGKIAYYYYKDKCDIQFYVDNDSKLWGQIINGLIIKQPTILKKSVYEIIVANKRHEREIIEWLHNELYIDHVLSFRLDEKIELFETSETTEDQLIVSFDGGLGNQMFQYALYRLLKASYNNVTADLSKYYRLGERDFQLCNVFKSIKLRNSSFRLSIKYKEAEKNNKLYYLEEDIWHSTSLPSYQQILDMQIGYIEGYHQTHFYADQIADILQEDFAFQNNAEEKLNRLIQKIEMGSYVSIHIRCGDYLTNKFQRIYGNICTEEYYHKAIEYILSKEKECIFVFFSNDIERVKKNFIMKNAIYIESTLFDHYEDWYDMYLMSVCKHNIIANSTFSWWGAWLNKNTEKIVVAPRKWANVGNWEDICPPEWTRL